MTNHNLTGTVINSKNCDLFDSVCTDYNDVYDTCDGAGSIVNGSCEDNIVYQSNGFVINQTNCNHLDTECIDYLSVDNTCDGSGNVVMATCDQYTDEPTSTQCGSDYNLYSCFKVLIVI